MNSIFIFGVLLILTVIEVLGGRSGKGKFKFNSNWPIKQGNSKRCYCSREYKPVCASNGHTYGNQCLFLRARKACPRLKILYQGACSETTTRFPPTKSTEPIITPWINQCVCNEDPNAVCGTNGVTYANACKLGCAARFDSSIEEAYKGECKSTTSVPKTTTF